MDIETLIRLAWAGVHRTFARDPGAFTRRLARRDAKTLRRPPLNDQENAARRRGRVREMLLAGYSYRQMMAELGVDFGTINRDTDRIYHLEGVSGRRGLARKLGVTIPTAAEQTRAEIRRRAAGQTWRRIASDMRMTFAAVDHHAKVIRKQRRATETVNAVPT